MSSPLSLEALRIAVSQVGVHEQPHGSNDGPEIKQYLLSAGLVKPNAWCMSFIYWCFNEAAKNLKVKNPLFKTGGVLRQWENSISNRQFGHIQGANQGDIGKVQIAQPGDIFILDHGHGFGHAGIIKSWDSLKLIYNTIEGNSNTDGSRDGEAVVNHTRKNPDPLLVGYLRF